MYLRSRWRRERGGTDTESSPAEAGAAFVAEDDVTLLAFAIAILGILIMAVAFLRGAQEVPEEHPVWGEPAMPERREAWEKWLAVQVVQPYQGEGWEDAK
jgi:hypothetical protein